MTTSPESLPGKDSLPGRERILDAARKLFAERGFDKTTMRAIAEAANVDVALIPHHFGNKRGIYMVATRMPINPAVVAHEVNQVPLDQLGTAIVGRLVELWRTPAGMSTLASFRSMFDEGPNDFFKVIDAVVWKPVRTRLRDAGYDDADERVDLAISAIVGLALGREILKFPALSTMAADDVVKRVGPVVQTYLTA